jgi:hypothetical protein
MDIMVRKAILGEILDEGREEAVIDYTGVNVEKLVGAKRQMNRISITEGSTSKSLSFDAANLITIGLNRPDWLAQQFKDRAPDFFAQFWTEEDEGPLIEPNGDFGSYGDASQLRSREILDFWAEVICAVEKDDVADDHYQRYYSDLYCALIRGNHHKMRIGIVPWGEGVQRDCLILRGVPKQIYGENPDDAREKPDTDSAAEADW